MVHPKCLHIDDLPAGLTNVNFGKPSIITYLLLLPGTPLWQESEIRRSKKMLASETMKISKHF